jgi:hypothetical protein
MPGFPRYDGLDGVGPVTRWKRLPRKGLGALSQTL